MCRTTLVFSTRFPRGHTDSTSQPALANAMARRAGENQRVVVARRIFGFKFAPIDARIVVLRVSDELLRFHIRLDYGKRTALRRGSCYCSCQTASCETGAKRKTHYRSEARRSSQAHEIQARCSRLERPRKPWRGFREFDLRA